MAAYGCGYTPKSSISIPSLKTPLFPSFPGDVIYLQLKVRLLKPRSHHGLGAGLLAARPDLGAVRRLRGRRDDRRCNGLVVGGELRGAGGDGGGGGRGGGGGGLAEGADGGPEGEAGGRRSEAGGGGGEHGGLVDGRQLRSGCWEVVSLVVMLLLLPGRVPGDLRDEDAAAGAAASSLSVPRFAMGGWSVR